jgi:hypothetical protein
MVMERSEDPSRRLAGAGRTFTSGHPNKESKMSKKKSAAKLAVAMEAAKQAKNHAGPALDDARERLAPMVEDARERLAPVMDDARERIAELTEVVATKLDERLPDDKTPAAVKAASAHSHRTGGGRLKKLLLVTGVGAAVFSIVRRLMGGGSSEPQWQSTTPTRTTPAAGTSSPVTTASPSAAAAGAASAAAASAQVGDETSHDVAAGSPDEALADATETAHVPTTPDAPAERIDVRE